MENNDQNQILSPETPVIELQQDSLAYLNETRKWTYFLAILGFIVIGLMIFLSLFMGLIFSRFTPGMNEAPFPTYLLAGIYLIFALIYFFPVWYLFKFSTWMKKGIMAMNSGDMNQAFRNLKSLFRFTGILTIVMMVFYVVALIVMMVVGLMKGLG